MKNNIFKAFFTAICSTLSATLGILYVPVLLMVGCNVIDYITGLMAAKNREDGKISSYRSIRGIAKKIGMWVLVIVGVIMDCLLLFVSDVLGFQMPFTFLVACIVAVWIVCNEIISILENLIDIGVNIPTFMIPLVKNIKAYTESVTGSSSEDSNYNNEKEEK